MLIFIVQSLQKQRKYILKKGWAKMFKNLSPQGPKNNLMHIEYYNICYYISYANL
jgi:hypothetical protein